MNACEVAEAVAASHGLSNTDARKIVDAVFAAIANAAVPGYHPSKVKRIP